MFDCVGRGPGDDLITRSEESYLACVCVCLTVCDLENSNRGSLSRVRLLGNRKIYIIRRPDFVYLNAFCYCIVFVLKVVVNTW